jgi:hypothetical protein
VLVLGFKWQRIVWKCWQTRPPYNEQTHEAALKISGSPLVAQSGEDREGNPALRASSLSLHP